MADMIKNDMYSDYTASCSVQAVTTIWNAVLHVVHLFLEQVFYLFIQISPLTKG